MRIKDERGSSMIDFLGFGLLLQIPVLVLATQLATIHANQLAADSIARHSLRTFVLHDTPAALTARQISADFRLKISPVVELDCEPDCTSPDSILRLKVSVGGVRAISVMVR
ncbi:MAG: hypothetical protein RLZ82_387 [Actinomycetota bacterium]